MMASKLRSTLRRSLLYVPASSQKMLLKSLGIKSDNMTYDLEDSVIPSMKESARTHLKTHLDGMDRNPAFMSEVAVRVNAVSTTFALEDIRMLASSPRLNAIVVPKVESAADLTFVTEALRHVAPERQAIGSSDPIKIIALIESARAVMNLSSICRASPYLDGLAFAAEDFALDLSITRTPSLKEFLYARSAIVTAARAYDMASVIDLVCTSYHGDKGVQSLEEECFGGKAMGFNGKQCIHPAQVDLVQRIFSPSEAEMEWAARVTIADEKAAGSGRGAWTLDGKMIDAPVVNKAKSIVARAEQAGLEIERLRIKYKGQEPE
ncbi:citrate lyase subunit beta-like protein [Fusarium oxysporum f. sp. pisi HDV247]|uniref:Citrate lyase subunit beta-like protein n=1 Tax=Fusarium oxysporum f. sp. pisi HDV247 TaxID=1080344 RepID=W9Q3D4_FUSOX|nr:citrate lyase subunit beta-like protein [Fusarium oxysporum f. sp. pisi HDV247]